MLNEKQLIKGIEKTVENAKSLLSDAVFLFDDERYSRAYTLFQLSIEEAGKCLILYNSILRLFQGEIIDEKHLRKYGYYDHKSKTKKSLKLELTALLMYRDGGNDIIELLTDLLNEEKLIREKNDKKNESLYVSLNGIDFLTPNEAISKSEVDDISKVALIRVKVAETFSSESTKDIDKLKFLAKEIQRIESDPKLESEFQQKISKWIND